MSKEIKVGRLVRDFPTTELTLTRGEDAATTLTFPASSEAPIDRWFGTEVLAHEKSAIRMERIERGAAPLLFNHDWNDPIGMIDRASVKDGRLIVDAHLFATARAQEVQQMIDGGLRNVSIGYQMHTVEEDSKTNIFTSRDWEPLEVSVVTVPADPSVGIGRANEQEVSVRVLAVGQPAEPATTTGAIMAEVQSTAPAGAAAESQPVHLTAAEVEVKRIDAVRKMCRANDIPQQTEQSWIARGLDWNAIGDELIEFKNARQTAAAAYIDMEPKEVAQYSLMRAIRASVNKDWSKAGLELEANKTLSKRMNRIPRSDTAFFVPLDVLMRDRARASQRDMTAAGVSGSNYLVSVDNQAGSFIDLLRNTSVALRAGATRMAGLVGNVTIPKMTAGNTAYWLSDENTAISESQPTIGQLPLSPKNVAAITELSHQLIQQSTPDAEQMVLSSIARDIGLAVDVGILRGSGASGQPQGIVGTSGVGSVSGSSIAAVGIIEFQSDVAGANALNPGCGYVTTPAVAGDMMVTPEIATVGTNPVWRGNMLEGSMFGFPAFTSNQMATATMLFGWWPSVILAEWGVLELQTNPYSDFTRGLTAVRGWYTCDVGMRYPAAFSYASSIT